MLAIIYKNLIECRKSLLLSLCGAAFIIIAFFISALISDGGDKNTVVSIVFILVMLFTYLMLGNGQSTLIGCDQNSRFYSFIFSAPNGRSRLIAAKYIVILFISVIETIFFMLAIKLLDCGLSLLVPVIFTLIQLTTRAIEAPFMFAFGEKTGGGVKGCIIGGIGMAFVINELYGDVNIDISWAMDFIFKFLNDKNEQHLWLVIIGSAVLVLYAVSMLLSFIVSRKSAVRFADSETE